MVSFRIDKKTENKIKECAEAKQVSKSEIIKAALDEYLEKHDQENSFYALAKDYAGKYDSGEESLSVNYKEHLKESIRAKNSR